MSNHYLRLTENREQKKQSDSSSLQHALTEVSVNPRYFVPQYHALSSKWAKKVATPPEKTPEIIFERNNLGRSMTIRNMIDLQEAGQLANYLVNPKELVLSDRRGLSFYIAWPGYKPSEAMAVTFDGQDGITKASLAFKIATRIYNYIYSPKKELKDGGFPQWTPSPKRPGWQEYLRSPFNKEALRNASEWRDALIQRFRAGYSGGAPRVHL